MSNAAGAPVSSGNDTLWSVLEKRANATPAGLMFVDEYERSISFGAFRELVERTAQGLVALGVQPGAKVAWQLPSRLETLALMAAFSRLGALQLPILPLYREREVGFLLKDVQPDFVFAPESLRGFEYVAMMRGLVAQNAPGAKVVPMYDKLPEAIAASLPKASVDSSVVRWIFATSGTTSEPKGVMHTDGTLLAAGLRLFAAQGITANDVMTLNFPVAHGGGPVATMANLAYGTPVVCTEVFDPIRAVALYRRHGVTVAGTGLPFYLAYLNEQRKTPGEKLIPTLRMITGGGAPKPPSVYFDVKRELGVPILHAFGMTEGLVFAQNRPGDSDEQLAYTDGLPLDDVEISIRDETGKVLSGDAEGELWVRGPMLFKGYTSKALTDASFDSNGFFRTGDYGRIRSDGHLAITGRIKDIIIRKGENISASEIENVLFRHPKIAELAVIGLPDEQRGERVCAVVVPRGDARITLAEISEACAGDGLARFKTPEQVEFVPQLPRNSTMKVLKTKLREMFAR